jgi:UDP-glucose 4-epimerase
VRVLVTGSTGLLGRVIGARLAAAGDEVVGLARGAAGAGQEFAEELRADIGAPDLSETLAGTAPCEAVVHCAASRSGDDGSSEIALTNCLGTQQVLEIARRWGSRRFVFLSGVTVIGRPRALPVTEEHPPDPQNAYLASKLFGEQLVRLASREGPAGVSLRVSAPVGPAMPRERILPMFVRRALAGEPLTVAGRGTRRQDYIDARDVAAAVEQALATRTSPVLNIAAGRSWANVELAERCVALLGSGSPILHSGDDPEDEVAWEVSIERARAELGWRPEHDLDRVIGDLADAQRSAPAASERSSSSPRP